MTFLRETAWVLRADQYSKEHRAEGKNEGHFWTKVVSMSQHWLAAAFFTKTSAEVQHRGYAMFKQFRIFAGTSKNFLQSLDYPYTVLEISFQKLPRLTLSTFGSKQTLKEEANRRL